ncbi:ABC transporter ATP-binding protein [Nitriliruptor alkaliphilus]|uniref:ABC transporter ATP-binding protein n=1 Tax=Nitriliruptor alkaliphilus TaxID=427918 RepID=UPI00069713BA|nr:ABC transporter ATP-binding protein [Nitriliruptor alkaliphilus]
MALLEIRDVRVVFGGIVAVDACSLELDAGRVQGLIGPNGAGKTTTFNVVTGLQAPTAGSIWLDGEDLTSVAPHLRARRGLARTFQRLEVFGSLSVRDNVRVALEIRDSWGTSGHGSTRGGAERLLDRVGIRGFADQPADAVPTGIARLTELARALAIGPRVLLLDEPSSGLNEEETHALGELLIRLADEGVAVLMVEHDVDLVMRTCSWIDVLDFGRIIASGPPAVIRDDPDVQAAYLGAEVDEAAADVAAVAGERRS